MRSRNLDFAALANLAVNAAQANAVAGTELSWVKAHLTTEGRLDCLIAIRKLEERTDAEVLKQAADSVVYCSFDQWFGQVLTNILTCRQATAATQVATAVTEEVVDKKAA